MAQSAPAPHPLIAPTAEDLTDRLNDLTPVPTSPWQQGLLGATNPATPTAYLNHLALTAHDDLPAHLLHLKNTLPAGTPLFITLLGSGSTNVPEELKPAQNRPFPTIQAAGDLLTRLGFTLPVVDEYAATCPQTGATWHVLTLHAHTPAPGQPQAKKPGSGKVSLVRILNGDTLK